MAPRTGLEVVGGAALDCAFTISEPAPLAPPMELVAALNEAFRTTHLRIPDQARAQETDFDEPALRSIH